MREEPLFNDDILISIYRHFNFFFTWSGLIVYAAIVLAVLFLNWLLVRFLFKREKLSLLPDARYAFADAPGGQMGGGDRAGAVFCRLCRGNSHSGKYAAEQF